jgi:hypothetical protein
MARIYNRDNINYSGLIGQAIQNANQTSQLYANKYQPWNTMGQGVGQVGEKLQQAGWREFGAQEDDARAQAMQQRQFEQQEKLQKAQQEFQALESAKARAQQIFLNEQNAQNALKLAKIQKEAQDEYNRDEWHMQYQNATADYDAAKAELIKDPNNIDKQRAFQRAEANVIRWGDKLNYDVYDAPEVPKNIADELPSVEEVAGEENPVQYTNAEIEKNLIEVLKGKWNDDNNKRANELNSMFTDKALQDKYAQVIANKGKTIEQSKRDFDALQAEALATLKKNPNALPPTGYKWVWKGRKKVGIAKK